MLHLWAPSFLKVRLLRKSYTRFKALCGFISTQKSQFRSRYVCVCLYKSIRGHKQQRHLKTSIAQKVRLEHFQRNMGYTLTNTRTTSRKWTQLGNMCGGAHTSRGPSCLQGCIAGSVFWECCLTSLAGLTVATNLPDH